MPRPASTVVVPCFNYGRFVREAVESALAQRGADVRVVVVDDGSDDGASPAACDACAGPLVRVVHQPNAGLPAARNRGVREPWDGAPTEYLTFLDADDTLEPEFVAKLDDAVRAADNPSLAPVSHAYPRQRLSELATLTWNVPDWDPLLLLITNLHAPTTLVRRAAFEHVGGFDESFTVGYEDWDLWIRMAEHGYRAVRVPEALYVWRRHSHDTMIARAVARHDEIYAHIVERHRALYERHALDLVRLANSLLRRFDCNWLDDTGYPIPLRYLWECRDALAPARAAADAERARAESLAAQVAAVTAERERLAAETGALRAELDAAAAAHASHPAVRLHDRVRRALAALPGPLETVVRLPLRAIKSLMPPGR